MAREARRSPAKLSDEAGTNAETGYLGITIRRDAITEYTSHDGDFQNFTSDKFGSLRVSGGPSVLNNGEHVSLSLDPQMGEVLCNILEELKMIRLYIETTTNLHMK